MIVVGTDISNGKFADVEKQLRAAGAQDVMLCTADVGKFAAMAKVATDAKAKFGSAPLRVIYANAGFITPPILDGTPEGIAGGLEVLTNGVIWTYKAFQDWFLNQKEPCALVATSSVAGVVPSLGSYGVGKHGCLAVMEALHGEPITKKATHVTCHVLCPGAVNTNFFTRPEEGNATAGAATPSYGDGDFRKRMRQSMRDTGAQRGMTPAHLADEVFRGIEKGVFYLIVDGEG